VLERYAYPLPRPTGRVRTGSVGDVVGEGGHKHDVRTCLHVCALPGVLFSSPLNRIVWVTFFILHLDMFLRNGRAVTLVSSFPSVLLYSSIDHTLAISYASCVVTSTLILFAFAGGKLVYEVLCPCCNA